MMDEYDESSDIEMVPMEEIIHVEKKPNTLIKATTKAESRVQPSDNFSNRSTSTFTTGIDIFSKEERLKMEERAKRFGLTEKLENVLSNEEDLYSSMGITDDGENVKNVRLNVIHVRGTEEMSTKDVLKYFQDYAPQSIEWINDISCNVVWFDNLSAARAMLGLSKKISGCVGKYSDGNLSSEADYENGKDCKDNNLMAYGKNILTNTSNNGKKENYINIKDIVHPLPPGTWRKGIDYPKSKAIFLRFATRMDRKQANAEKISEYYKKYGNPNFGGIKGILTESRKRMYKQTKQTQQNKHRSTEKNKQIKNPWGALSETWGVNDIVEDDFLPRNDPDHGRSVKDRLGTKFLDKDAIRAMESTEASSSSDSEENWCKRSKVLRMRMHADDEEEKQQKRRAKLRYQMILNNLNNSGDLRSKLGKPRMKMQYCEPIQVVITNMNPPKSKSLKHDSGSEIAWRRDQIMNEIKLSEREEGEWQESETENDQEKEDEKIEQSQHRQYSLMEDEEEKKEEERQEEEEEEKDKNRKDEEDSADEDSNIPAKEVQGPKGSVIKVVPPKPRVASTVWARLNHVKSEINDSYLKKRQSGSHNLRNILKGGDLRSRIGNHTRGRSPLRIEVKNDKYTRNESDGE
ncbi:nuclear cap-binding protein subunit 3-like isoform X2 [Odontomachus brunneus]|nr:nuclear cap-binding protein subunit 3-like isoform X2 [Odontomachus brunneus]